MADNSNIISANIAPIRAAPPPPSEKIPTTEPSTNEGENCLNTSSSIPEYTYSGDEEASNYNNQPYNYTDNYYSTDNNYSYHNNEQQQSATAYHENNDYNYGNYPLTIDYSSNNYPTTTDTYAQSNNSTNVPYNQSDYLTTDPYGQSNYSTTDPHVQSDYLTTTNDSYAHSLDYNTYGLSTTTYDYNNPTNQYGSTSHPEYDTTAYDKSVANPFASSAQVEEYPQSYDYSTSANAYSSDYNAAEEYPSTTTKEFYDSNTVDYSEYGSQPVDNSWNQITVNISADNNIYDYDNPPIQPILPQQRARTPDPFSWDALESSGKSSAPPRPPAISSSPEREWTNASANLLDLKIIEKINNVELLTKCKS